MSVLPNGWVWVDLLEAARPTGVSINPSNFADERFTLYSVPSFDSRTAEEVRGADIGSNKQIVNTGTLLVCKINPRINRIWIVGNHQTRILASTEWIALDVHSQLDTKYVSFYLQNEHVRRYLAENASGVGGSLMRIRPAVLGSLTLPIPPLAEQCRIVAEIDKQFTRLDTASFDCAQLSFRLRALRSLALKPLVVGHPPRPLASLLSDPLANGRSVPTAKSGEQSFDVLKLTAVRDGRIDLDQAKPGAWSQDNASRFVVRRGDFLIVRGNGSRNLVGRGGVVGEVSKPVAYPDTLIRARFNEDLVHLPFLVAVWNSKFVRQQIETTARTTAGIYKINQQDLERLIIPMPDLELQKELFTDWSDRESILWSVHVTTDRTNTRIGRLRQAILAKAFSGQLVPHDPNDEPASVLLQRIQADTELPTKRPIRGRRVGTQEELALQS